MKQKKKVPPLPEAQCSEGKTERCPPWTCSEFAEPWLPSQTKFCSATVIANSPEAGSVIRYTLPIALLIVNGLQRFSLKCGSHMIYD